MNVVSKLLSRTALEVAVVALALSTSACGAETDAAGPNELGSSTEALALSGPWQFSSEDFEPPSLNVSSLYSVNGNSINFTYQGKALTVSGPAVSGIHFTQPVSVVQGGAYRLQLTVTNLVGASPTLFAASLSGAAPASTLVPVFGNSSATIDFAVTASPGPSPTIELINKPLTVRPGVGLQNFTVTATLTQTN